LEGDTKECPSEIDIDLFIADVSVEIWTIHEKIFFAKYNKQPSYHTLEFKG